MLKIISKLRKIYDHYHNLAIMGKNSQYFKKHDRLCFLKNRKLV